VVRRSHNTKALESSGLLRFLTSAATGWRITQHPDDVPGEALLDFSVAGNRLRDAGGRVRYQSCFPPWRTNWQPNPSIVRIK
jgi:hypothetical protein